MSNTWKSRYGQRFVSFPSIIEELNLDYEITKEEV
jgi:hypothetical protein